VLIPLYHAGPTDGWIPKLELIKSDLAWWYHRYPPEDKELEVAEGKAWAGRKGPWSGPKPVAPEEWRRRSGYW
jgi:micrococcal nuclease